MNYSHGVLHDHGHSRGATVPLPVTVALLTVLPVVVPARLVPAEIVSALHL